MTLKDIRQVLLLDCSHFALGTIVSLHLERRLSQTMLRPSCIGPDILKKRQAIALSICLSIL